MNVVGQFGHREEFERLFDGKPGHPTRFKEWMETPSAERWRPRDGDPLQGTLFSKLATKKFKAFADIAAECVICHLNPDETWRKVYPAKECKG